MAGVSRQQYTTETRVIRVMCSGRVDLEFVLRAFANGIDGVFIGGCRLNECNYITHGNYHALNMVLLCKKIMEHIGLNPERLRIEFMSSAEGIHFSEVMSEFGNKVKELGPIGKAEGISEDELKSRLAEITRLVPYIKLVENKKLGTRLLNPEEYDKLFTTLTSRYMEGGNKCKSSINCFSVPDPEVYTFLTFFIIDISTSQYRQNGYHQNCLSSTAPTSHPAVSPLIIT